MKQEELYPELRAHGNDLYDINVIAKEIVAYTKDSPENVWRKLAQELDHNGTNVISETKRFDVTPHVFNQSMINFYTNSDGFIYETCIESRHPYRISKWLRIAAFMEAGLKQGARKVLVYGDSVGNDCIFLKRMGFDVSYHDYDSYCSRFAKERFKHRNLQISSFLPGSKEVFDYVICFEVAEHVPDPVALVAELADLTAPKGYCIFSESFGLIAPQFPTHIQTNVAFVGRDDELFAKHGMHVEWRDDHNKPIVYTRHPSANRSRQRRGILSKIKRKLRAAYRG